MMWSDPPLVACSVPFRSVKYRKPAVIYKLKHIYWYLTTNLNRFKPLRIYIYTCNDEMYRKMGISLLFRYKLDMWYNMTM